MRMLVEQKSLGVTQEQLVHRINQEANDRNLHNEVIQYRQTLGKQLNNIKKSLDLNFHGLPLSQKKEVKDSLRHRKELSILTMFARKSLSTALDPNNVGIDGRSHLCLNYWQSG